MILTATAQKTWLWRTAVTAFQFYWGMAMAVLGLPIILQWGRTPIRWLWVSLTMTPSPTWLWRILTLAASQFCSGMVVGALLIRKFQWFLPYSSLLRISMVTPSKTWLS